MPKEDSRAYHETKSHSNFKLFLQLFYIFRVRRRVDNPFSRLWVCERQGQRVQSRARNQVCVRGAIQDISEQWIPQRRQMRADLVCTACQRTRFEQGPGLSPYKDFEVRFRGFAPFMVDGGTVLVSHVDS